MRVQLVLACLGAALLPLAAIAAESNGALGPVGSQRAIVPTTRLIIRLRPAAPGDRVQIAAVRDRTAAVAGRQGIGLRGLREFAPGLMTVALEAPLQGADLDATLARLRADPDVEFAEPDQRRFHHAVPTDPLYANQWYLQGTETAGIDAEPAWEITAGTSDTVIAVLDTGVRFDHPDLGRDGQGGRLLPGYDFVSGESSTSFLAANDGDGWDGDPSDPGDWIEPDDTRISTFRNCQVANSSWHGTRVAGIIGALTNNGAGIAGATWEGRILPVRVLGKCGGFDSDIITAMRWAAGLHVSGVADTTTPAKILNLSLGGSGSCSSAYRQVMTELSAAGVLVVASAGNETGPVDSPANCAGVLAVAGVRHVGTKVGYSSFGAEVGVSAPAGNCVNLTGPCLFALDTTDNTGPTTPIAASYTDQVNANLGTSFSAPIVAAIAGLMHGVNGNLRPAEFVARIESGARSFPAGDPNLPTCPSVESNSGQCNCTTATCGAGLANAPGAVNEALRPVARIGDPGRITRGTPVPLDGTTSAAARSRNIAGYSWTVVDGGANPPAITGAGNSVASVVAPAAGALTVRLTVTDDQGRQDAADLVVTSAVSAGGGGGALDTGTLLGIALAGLARRRRTAARTLTQR